MQHHRLEALGELDRAMGLDLLAVHERVCRLMGKDEQQGLFEAVGQLLPGSMRWRGSVGRRHCRWWWAA